MKKLIAILLLVIILGGCSESPEIKSVVQNIQTLKNTLRDPDSLKIYNDIIIIDDDITNTQIMYIDYGAKNGLGNMGRKTAMFSDDQYLGNYEDVKSHEVTDIDFSIKYLTAGVLYIEYLNGTDTTFIKIDKDMVIKKIK